MKGQKSISCRKARQELQEVLDRFDLVSITDDQSIATFASKPVRAHVERCRECTKFVHTLKAFAPLLRQQLDQAVQDIPGPVFEAAVQDKKEYRQRVPAERGRVRDSIFSVFQTLRRWLSGPVQGPAGALRWTAVSLAGLVLVSLIGLRIHTVYRTNRAIAQEIDRIVELIYQDTLLADIESALVRTQPSISGYVEDSQQATNRWFGSTDPESQFN